MAKITAPAPMTVEQLQDYVVYNAAAFIGYWAEDSEITDDGFSITDHYGETESSTWDELRTAMSDWAEDIRKRYLETGNVNNHFLNASKDILYRDWDVLDMDSAVADQIVQQALFGKIIYG